MIFGKVGKPTKTKKAVYLVASVILGALLSLLAHAAIEINYLRWARNQNLAVTFYDGCALPPWLQTALWAAGVAGGFFLGRLWWRKIYIERVWAKR